MNNHVKPTCPFALDAKTKHRLEPSKNRRMAKSAMNADGSSNHMPLCPACKGEVMTTSTEFDEDKTQTCDECGKRF